MNKVMKGFLKIGGTVLGLAVVVFALNLWYRVFIVGRYYENGSVLDNTLVGGTPLWILIVIVGAFAIRKNWKKGE